MLNCRTCGRRWGRTGCPSSPWWLFCPPSSWRGKTKEPAFSREWAVCTPLPSTCYSWESPVRKAEKCVKIYVSYTCQMKKSSWTVYLEYGLKICVSSQGSIANKVFHEVLLDTCADLTSHCWPQDTGKKRKKDGLKSSQAEGKRSKPQRKDPPEVSSAFEKSAANEWEISVRHWRDSKTLKSFFLREDIHRM